MCHATTCRTCGKTTWEGCGQHIDAVRRTVPAAQWCPGHPGETNAGGGGFLAKLFGR